MKLITFFLVTDVCNSGFIFGVCFPDSEEIITGFHDQVETYIVRNFMHTALLTLYDLQFYERMGVLGFDGAFSFNCFPYCLRIMVALFVFEAP